LTFRFFFFTFFAGAEADLAASSAFVASSSACSSATLASAVSARLAS
jgi:hypothetical protein